MADSTKEEWFKQHGAAFGAKAGTDYNKWSRYDVEKDEEITSTNFVSDDFREAAKTLEGRSQDQYVAAGDEALELAAALKSQAAVEALKAASSGGSKGRRRRKKVVEPVPQDVSRGELKHSHIPAANPEPTKSKQETPKETDSSESKGIITALSEIINKASLQFAKLIGEMKLLSSDVETGNERACELGMKLIKKIDSFVASNLRDAKDIETRAIAGGLKNMTQVKSSTVVLDKIEESARGMAMQAASKTAIAAIHSRRYALAADVTRFWLKTTQADSAAARAAEDQRRQLKGAEGTQAAKEDVEAEKQGAASASMWLLRAAAFLGMGCTYLANTHIRQVIRICPDFPRLKAVQTCVDKLEEKQMQQLNTSRAASASGAVLNNADLVNRQVRLMEDHLKFTRRVECAAHDYVRSLDVHALSTEMLLSLFDPLSSITTGGPQKKEEEEFESTRPSISTIAPSLHMVQPDEEEEGLDAGSSGGAVSRNDTDSSQISSEEQCTAVIRESEPLVSLLHVIHEQYYQAQLLYMENLYCSASFKYFAVLVFVQELLLSPRGTSSNESCTSLKPYLEALQSSCFVNTAMCKARSCQFEKNRRGHSRSSSPLSSLLEASLSCLDLTQADPLLLCEAGLTRHTSVLGCIRAAEVAEEMQCYDEGLLFLQRAWKSLLPQENQERIEALSNVDPTGGDQAVTEAVWEEVWIQCKNTIETTSAEEVPRLVHRYPRKQRFSQTFLAGSPVEPLAPDHHLEESVEVSCRSSVILGPQEVPPLVAYLYRTRKRLAFKHRRFEGA